MKAPARYQIVVLSANLDGLYRWSFVAHGATWSEEEARDYADKAKARGQKATLLRVPS